jgi:DNA-directed RNA polymerase subunit RPC12/RpoP
MEKSQNARCIHCRSEVEVPEAYAHGDHIKCGSCGTKHKVSRGDILRLVLADTGPAREALQSNQALIERIEDELLGARRSFGIGVNGLGVGVAYFLYQVAFHERQIGADLAWQAAGVGLFAGVVLELVNFLFLAKRQRIRRLSSDLDEAREEGRRLQKLLRDSGRV